MVSINAVYGLARQHKHHLSEKKKTHRHTTFFASDTSGEGQSPGRAGSQGFMCYLRNLRNINRFGVGIGEWLALRARDYWGVTRVSGVQRR